MPAMPVVPLVKNGPCPNGYNAQGNYYKFIVTSDTPVEESLPSLETTTSRVYDYYLGVENNIVTNHACLPIWYKQDSEITDRVLRELYQKG